MEFTIIPYVGAGKVLFGMTSPQISEALYTEPKRFKKFEDDEINVDDYGWCHVYYKNPGVCQAIEFFEPAKVLFMGWDIIGNSFKDIKKLFIKHDRETEFDEAGLTSYKYGISIYAPFAQKNPSDSIEGVLVFEKGYYE